jgi:hypothetical protein
MRVNVVYAVHDAMKMRSRRNTAGLIILGTPHCAYASHALSRVVTQNRLHHLQFTTIGAKV